MTNIIEYLKNVQDVNLSEQQVEAVLAPHKKILLLAVPGAGKTTVLTARIADYIVNKSVDVANLLVLTFSKEAANDMKNRWEILISPISTATPDFRTIHSFCYKLIQEYCAEKNSTPPRLLTDNSIRNKMLINIYNEFHNEFISDDDLAHLVTTIGYCTNKMLLPEEVSTEINDNIIDFTNIYNTYKRCKRENNYMDFDDMLLYAYHIINRYPHIQQRLKQRYQCIFVDEIQDTTKLQQEIIFLLSGDNLFMVGDEDQSIYGFRGAHPQGILGLQERYTDCKLLLLEENYRSTQRIVETATTLINHNKNRVSKNMRTPHIQGDEIQVVTEVTARRQYDMIVQDCVRMSQNSTCAILYRNSFTGIILASQLNSKNIPYSATDTSINYASDFISRDIVNILRLAENQGNVFSFKKVYYRLKCGINREIVKSLPDSVDNIFEYLMDYSSENDRSTAKLIYLKHNLDRMKTMTLEKQIDVILDKIDYVRELEKSDILEVRRGSYVQRITVLKQLAKDCETVDDFVEKIASAPQLLQRKGRCNIHLSTVHSAKGQEYDNVIIADAVDGIFPSSDAIEDYLLLDDEDGMEEELRLFYTAITRAKKTLTIYAPEESDLFNVYPSRFLKLGGLYENVSTLEGRRITHAYFGVGNIVADNSERGTVSISFKHYGTKTFTAASLKNPEIFQML